MDALQKAEWIARNAKDRQELAEAQEKLRRTDAQLLYSLLAKHAPDALEIWKAERPAACEYSNEIDKVSMWLLDNKRLQQTVNELRNERDALKVALIFYADGIITDKRILGTRNYPACIAPDDGTFARAALEPKGEG